MSKISLRSYCLSVGKIGSLASYIPGLLVAVPLLFCEIGLSDVDRVITLNIDKDADHSRFIVEKHVIDDVIFYAYYPRLGYQVDCVYSGCYGGWITNYDLKSDFCYALANYDYIHKKSLFYEIKSATPVYSTTLLQTIFQCPDLQDHLLRATIAIKYLKETHFFSKDQKPSLVTKADDTYYVEPPGYVRDANSLDVPDLVLKGLHFETVSQFIGYEHDAGSTTPPSQPESDPGEIGEDQRLSDESSRINEVGGGDNDDQLIVLARPEYTISIQQDTHQIEPFVPSNESQESSSSRSHTPTLPPIPEDECEYSTSSLPLDSSGSLDQHETYTIEATREETEATREETESSEGHIETAEDSNISVQPVTELNGSQDPDSTVHLDSVQPETEDSASLVVTLYTNEDLNDISSYDDLASTAYNVNQEAASEDPVQSSELQPQNTIVSVEHVVSDSSGTNEQNLSTVQSGSSESLTEESITSVMPDSSDKLESSETSSQGERPLTEAESSTVLHESELNESTEGSLLSQEGGSGLQVEAEESSSDVTAEPTLSQEVRIVKPDSSYTEAVDEIVTDVSNEQTISQDSTPPLSGTSTAEVEEEQDLSEDATSLTHADQSAEAAAEPGESEQHTSSDQHEQIDVFIDQDEYDESTGLHSFGNDLSVLHYSVDRYDHVQKIITFSDGVIVKYGFFIMNNTPLGTTPDPPDLTYQDIPLLSDDESDDGNDYDVYLTDHMATLGEPTTGLQEQTSTPPCTVEHTISTDSSSLAPDVESTNQHESTSVDDRLEQTSSEDSNDHNPPDDSGLLNDQKCPTHHADITEVPTEESDKSPHFESITDQTAHSEVLQSSVNESQGFTETVETDYTSAHNECNATSSEEPTSKSNLRAADLYGAESVQPYDHCHTTLEEVTENHSENVEDKSEFPTSSLEQHTTPVLDCSIWF
ncbi:hypothetical protein MACK_002588 [Theileria orientalis]|uniref:Uncharacterized protein n=1 Tax=Theileria orientalis TaxID=68886 RepID=A0A976QVM1_THEOR|nr:hypothetical protein MACK_002588 [Theileria orientalis]